MDFNNQENNQNVEVQQDTVQAENVAPAYNAVPPMYNAVPPTYVPEQPANPNNGMAIGALICGIVGIVLCCCCGISAIVGIVGIVLAILSKNKNGGKMSGMAIAGLICSIASVVFGIASCVFWFTPGTMDAFWEGFNEGYYGY